MSKKNEITVNVHGLLGETGCVQIKLPEDRINEGDKFIYEKIGYQITRKIEEDVEHPILYVIVLDIFVWSYKPNLPSLFLSHKTQGSQCTRSLVLANYRR